MSSCRSVIFCDPEPPGPTQAQRKTRVLYNSLPHHISIRYVDFELRAEAGAELSRMDALVSIADPVAAFAPVQPVAVYSAGEACGSDECSRGLFKRFEEDVSALCRQREESDVGRCSTAPAAQSAGLRDLTDPY